MIKNKPTIVCLCGSTRFGEQFAEANLRETLAGNIVLTIGCSMRSDAELFKGMDSLQLQMVKADLDELHKRKIDMADEVLILNVDGYVGDSTFSELIYAARQGKIIRWLEPENAVFFGQSDHPTVFTPIKACSCKDPVDGTCRHKGAPTPECHVFCCPRLDNRICNAFDTPGSGDREKNIQS